MTSSLHNLADDAPVELWAASAVHKSTGLTPLTGDARHKAGHERRDLIGPERICSSRSALKQWVPAFLPRRRGTDQFRRSSVMWRGSCLSSPRSKIGRAS